jgi:signal transduction histidine kinase
MRGSTHVASPRLALLGLIAAAAVALGAGTLLLVHRSPTTSLAEDSFAGAAALLGAGWLAIGGGLSAWRHRRDSRFGPVLVAAGTTWFLTEWINPGSGSALVFTTGLVLHAACPPLVAHAALVQEAGSSHPPGVRLALLLGYGGALLLLGFGPALFFDPVDVGCHFCPENLLLVVSLPDAVRLLEQVGTVVLTVGLSVVAVLVGRHLARATPAARRMRSSVVVPALVFIVLALYAQGSVLLPDLVGSVADMRGLWFAEAVALAAVGLGTLMEPVRLRRARRAVAELVVELDTTPPAGGLKESLAAALGDPGLVIAYPIADGTYVDADGNPVVATALPGRAISAVVREGEPIAILVHRADLLGEPRRVEEVTSGARLGLQHERLQAEERAQLAELRRSRLRIVEAGDAERRRIERDLHDGTQQSLVGLSLALRLLHMRLGVGADPVAVTGVEEAELEVRKVIEEVRRIARGVHPAVLSDEGLATAVLSLGDVSPIIIEAMDLPDRRLPGSVETAAYHLVAETAKTGPVHVNLTTDDTRLLIELGAARPPERFVDLEDRLGAIDGVMGVSSVPDGTVRLWAEIPCG